MISNEAIALFNLCNAMGIDMPVIDITTFVCSKCGEPIPDRVLAQARLRSTAGGISITCPACDADEQKKPKLRVV